MDSYQGRNNEPLTLHKYAYGNLDPVNGIDPSGHMTLGGLMTGITNVARMAVSSVRSAATFFIRGGRVNGVRVQAGLRVRLWLHRAVGNVQSKLPRSFGKGSPSRDGIGWRWNGRLDGRQYSIRVQKGNPNARYASQRVDYVKISSNRNVIGRNGRPQPNRRTPDAHIPLSEWRTWAKWDSPL